MPWPLVVAHRKDLLSGGLLNALLEVDRLPAGRRLDFDVFLQGNGQATGYKIEAVDPKSIRVTLQGVPVASQPRDLTQTLHWRDQNGWKLDDIEYGWGERLRDVCRDLIDDY